MLFFNESAYPRRDGRGRYSKISSSPERYRYGLMGRRGEVVGSMAAVGQYACASTVESVWP
ncbi:hypothetical protein P691DRAFT_809656 [Macrolepiota fuliginosa MF-IS2]|uniref:Uncharacterized protein n=1 Tax=Macrolepiota fuliginosa MF-IS2 TaxID=1400762 RepID=A0A9P6BZ11_9AGAR|nr:hypothetical protein P691DRAFT_809656 [Macrolepiota fuliginosa MF-IS2]